MHRRHTFALITIAFIGSSLGKVTAAPSVFPTGVTVYDPKMAYDTFVLFGAPDEKTHLIDMDGNEVHSWNDIGHPSELLAPDVVQGAIGHVLVQLESDDQPGAGVVPDLPAELRKGHSDRTIGELDWSGNVVWKWGEEAPGGVAQNHHDWERLANGNTLVLAHLLHSVKGFKQKKILDDVIYEVGPDGRVVWKWILTDHVSELGFTPEQLVLVHNSLSADAFHINDMTSLGPNRWLDAGDTRFAPENILISSRNANFILIISKKTGEVVWRLGPNFPQKAAIRKAGDKKLGAAAEIPRPADQLSGAHDAHLIPKGLPGAGNLLVFDNQGEAGYPPVALGIESGSRVLEIDPVTKEVVWQYTAGESGQPGWTFHCPFIGSARRLPNGNTLVDEGCYGRFFQVTRAGRIAWEYVNPHFAETPVGPEGQKVWSNWSYRAQPVPYDWVPAGTPHAEKAVIPPDNTSFHIPTTP